MIALLLTLGFYALLLISLHDTLNAAKAYGALWRIGKVLKLLFVLGWAALILIGLICLLMIVLSFVIDRVDTWELMVYLLLMLPPLAMIFTRVQCFGKWSKLAGQLRTVAYVPSSKPETWAILATAACFVYFLTPLLLRFLAPSVPEALRGNEEEKLFAQLSDILTDRNASDYAFYLPCANSALSGAACYVLHLMLKTLRLNSRALAKK